MTNSYNLGGISRMNVDPTLGGLVDGTDFPHSGLFKTLNVATQGNYAIIDGTKDAGTNNFDIVQSASGSNTVFTVAAGKVMRDGKVESVTGVAFTQQTPATFDEPASGNAYYLIVVTSANALALRDNGNKDTTDTIPQLTAGDIPVAVIKLENGGTTAMRQIQYLTTPKEENSLTIGRANTGYTESLTIQNDGSDNTTIESKVSDKDIIFKANDGGTPTEVMRIDGSTSRVGIGNTAPTATLQVDGTDQPLLVLKKTDGASTGDAMIELFDGATASGRIVGSGSNLYLQTSTNDAGQIYFTAKASTPADAVNVETDVFRVYTGSAGSNDPLSVNTTTSRVGIKTNSPAETLDVNGTAKMTGIKCTGTCEVDGTLDHDGSNIGFFGTAPTTQQSVATLGAQVVNASPVEPTAAEVGSTQAAIDAIQLKLDALINALDAYGLV